jgi:hypothetical protein
MKQTAVEWLYSELINHLDMPHRHIQELVEQAKEMGKQQLVDFFIKGQTTYPSEHVLDNQQIAEQYYNETFKSK